MILILGPVMLFALIFHLTKDEPKVYTSRTKIYTGIATGANLTSLESSKVDRQSTITAFDNLINVINSRGTAEEVGLRLFVQHMLLEKPTKEIISRESYSNLKRIVPDEVSQLVVEGNYEETYKNFLNYKNKDFENFIYELSYLNHPVYSFEKILSKLKVRRLYSSDMIEITYKSNDPGICKQTLQIFNEVFVEKYSAIKLVQSDAILKYFQNQLDDAQVKLDRSEDQLLKFNKQNNIINYYEQSEHITIQKERFSAYYNELKMELKASEAVLKVLEDKLTVQQKKELNNAEIIKLRNQIAELNIEISVKDYQAEFDTITDTHYQDEIADMRAKSFQLQEKLRNSINQAYFIDNSVDGINSTSVLNQWLVNVVAYESTRAKMLVGDEKNKEFERLVKEYAPKGATMKRLERKIDIAEKEYLSILHSLNVAKLKQQNLELNTNLKVSEEPNFPLKSEPSKRKILLLIGMVIGFIIPAFVIIALDFLNPNIRNVANAQKLTKLNVISIFPNMVKRAKRRDYGELKRLSVNKLFQGIFNLVNGVENRGPIKAIIYSTQDGEGKTCLGNFLLEHMNAKGFKCLLINHKENSEDSEIEQLVFDADGETLKCTSVSNLVKNKNVELSTYDFVLVELPSINLNNYPVKLFSDADLALLTVRANRSWSSADKNALAKLEKQTQHLKQGVILNGVELDEMEKMIGEIPGERSLIRRFIKKVISFQIYSKKLK
ncbi:hypothetical protein [Marinifilum breve]|uniref:hypothetical protein n=1 Tax=Marinifilum breve TaxID=2184082 RepID=UPI001403E152|nr:hypothetical protein [Marinifilum breve]